MPVPAPRVSAGTITIMGAAQPITMTPNADNTYDGILFALYFGSGQEQLFCRFDASANSGTVPSAALATFPSGDGGFTAASIAHREVIAGDWAIEVQGYFKAIWPDGVHVTGSAKFL